MVSEEQWVASCIFAGHHIAADAKMNGFVNTRGGTGFASLRLARGCHDFLDCAFGNLL